jgi:hypothetical protein
MVTRIFCNYKFFKQLSLFTYFAVPLTIFRLAEEVRKFVITQFVKQSDELDENQY